MTLAPVREPVSRTAFHPLTVAAVERLTDDAVAVTFDVPDELCGTCSTSPPVSR